MSTSGGGCGSLDKATKAYMFVYQEAESLVQAIPVQNTWYTIGAEMTNAQVYVIGVNVEDTNETLEVQVLIDGETITANPTAAEHSTSYLVELSISATSGAIYTNLISAQAWRTLEVGPWIQGASIEVQVRKTTAAGVGNLTGHVVWGQLNSI